MFVPFLLVCVGQLGYSGGAGWAGGVESTTGTEASAEPSILWATPSIRHCFPSFPDMEEGASEHITPKSIPDRLSCQHYIPAVNSAQSLADQTSQLWFPYCIPRPSCRFILRFL